MATRTPRMYLFLLVPALALAPACAPAIGAAAGAAAAVAYDERNASSEVSATVPNLVGITATVFQEMGITETNRSTAADGGSAELRGTMENMSITVDIRRSDAGTTRVIVTAREGEVGYRPSQAGRILEQIIQRT